MKAIFGHNISGFIFIVPLSYDRHFSTKLYFTALTLSHMNQLFFLAHVHNLPLFLLRTSSHTFMTVSYHVMGLNVCILKQCFEILSPKLMQWLSFPEISLNSSQSAAPSVCSLFLPSKLEECSLFEFNSLQLCLENISFTVLNGYGIEAFNTWNITSWEIFSLFYNYLC